MEYTASDTRLRCVILEPLGFLLIPEYSLELPKKLLRRMLCSRIWHKYQRGCLLLPEAAAQLSKLPFVAPRGWAPDEIARLVRPRTVLAVPWMLQLLDMLRDCLDLKLVCACNSSLEELQELRRQFPALFAKFDATITSGEEGVGKPSVRFLQIALDKSGFHAQQTLYIDSFNSLESITAARSLGMYALSIQPGHIDELNRASWSQLRDVQLIRHIECAISSRTSGVVPSFTTTPSGSTTTKMEELRPAVADIHVLSAAVTSAQQFFLETIAAHDSEQCPFIQLPSVTSEGIRIYDNFAQFIIADLLENERFLPMQSAPSNGLITFVNTSAYLATDKNGTNGGHVHVADKLDGRFYASDWSTFIDIPHDLDTTSIGLSVLHKFGKVDTDTLNKVLGRMLENVSDDEGILQVYFDADRPRIDPVVVANAVFLFHLGKRGHEVEKSEKFVESVLRKRAYEEGTLYYNLGEAFLVSVARLVHRFKEHFDARSGMRRALEERLREGATSAGVQENNDDALALAMRIRACSLCGLQEEGLTRAAEQELVRLQCKTNGAWDCHPFYRYGSNALSWIGNEALTTAYALASLR